MYIKLNEQNQSIEYPPINKDNICNYNLANDLLENDGYVDVNQNLIDLFNQGKAKIENNSIIDISQTSEYLKKIRLAEIEQELLQADVDYETVLNTAVEYTNGHTYKPVFINDYVLLVASGLSYEIWSDDEIYSEIMGTASITQLALFLKSIAEPKYQERKIKRKALLEEKANLLG